MRTVFIILSLLLAMPQWSLADRVENKCRKGYNSSQDGLTLAQQMTSDLLSGIWTYNFDGGTQILEFHNNGKLDILQENIRGEIQHVDAAWRVEEYNGHAFLVMKPAKSKEEQLYQMEPTCDGMKLTNVIARESKELVFESKVQKDFYNQVKNLLTGTWRSISYPFNITDSTTDCGTVFQIEDAFLEISLNSNGQYTMRLGSNEYEVEETGSWTLTSDASHIIFRTSNMEAGETGRHRAAAINMLEFHEMVLEQKIAMDITDKKFCSEWKPFSLHKLSI